MSGFLFLRKNKRDGKNDFTLVYQALNGNNFSVIFLLSFITNTSFKIIFFLIRILILIPKKTK